MQQPCPYCASTAKPHYVHGHLQCSTCGKNIDDCCSGETMQEKPEPPKAKPGKKD